MYRFNIRRGNTVIDIYNKNGNIEKTFFERKGLQKFFDLHFEYMEFNLGEI